jgi:tRNA nucleotidyltransferase (CCA-adding enzyme)
MAQVATELVVPDYGLTVLGALESAGFEAWVVGGWVRDALMGRPSHDVDVCTSARWQETESVLEAAGIEVHETGTAHGTVTAVVGGRPVEVTTYRVEGSYSDLRHPDSVTFVSDVREDLARRDLTINAIAFHPARGLLDPFGGREDIERRLIRAVGDPGERLAEDALRVLRAVRFACRLEFDVEPATQAAIELAAPELAHVARERVGAELDGLLASGRGGWALTRETDVMAAAIPALGALAGFDQRSPYHCYDVLVHTAHVMDATEALTCGAASKRLRWAAMLHDIGKPRCFSVGSNGQGHFFGHPAKGARMADAIMRDLAIPLEVTRPAVALVRLHDRPMRATRTSCLKMLADLERRVPGQAPQLAHELIIIKRADALAKAAPYRGYAFELEAVAQRLDETLAEGACYRVGDLAVDGSDVMAALGIASGPKVGECLHDLLDAAIEGKVANERESLLTFLREKDDGVDVSR